MKPIVTKNRPVVTCHAECIRDLTEWKGLQKLEGSGEMAQWIKCLLQIVRAET